MFSISIVLGSVGGAISPAWAQKEKRVALVIGNANYDNGISRLANPLNDAADIADALESIGFNVIRAHDLDVNAFRDVLERFAQDVADANVGLFYYAGHAMHFEDDSRLMPIGVQLNDKASVRFKMISVENDVIKNALADVPIKILILDACRDNPIANQLSLKSANRSLEGARGLAPMIDARQGMLIAYATKHNQVAEDGNGRNSPFSESLKTHLKEPGVEIRPMFDEVVAEVREKTHDRQQPEISQSLPFDVFLSPGESDEVLWSDVRESRDRARLEDFITRFPKSSHWGEAKERIRTLDLEDKVKHLEAEAAARDEAARKADDAAKEAAKAVLVLEQEAEHRKKAAIEQAAKDDEDRLKRAAAEKEAVRQGFEEREEAEAARVEAHQHAARLEAAKLFAERAAALEAGAARMESDRADAARQAAEKDAVDKAQRAKVIGLERLDREAIDKAEADRQDAIAKAEAARKEADAKADEANRLKNAQDNLLRKNAEQAKTTDEARKAAKAEEARRPSAAGVPDDKTQAKGSAPVRALPDAEAQRQIDRERSQKRVEEVLARQSLRKAKKEAERKAESAKRIKKDADETHRRALDALTVIRAHGATASAKPVRPTSVSTPQPSHNSDPAPCMTCGF